MSTPRPFPPSNQPGGIAPPPWQTGGPGTPAGPAGGGPIYPPATPIGGPGGGLTPGGGPPDGGKNKAPLIAGVLAIVAVVAIVITVVVSGGDDSSGGSLDAKKAAAGVQAIVDDTDFAEDGPTADLSRCPFGKVDDLVAALPKSVNVSSDLLESGGDTGDYAVANPTGVECDYQADDPTSIDDGPARIAISASLDPDKDFENFVRDNVDPSVELEFTDTGTSYRSGSLYSFCGTASGQPDACGASWVNTKDKISITVLLAGDVNIKGAVDSLKSVLPKAVAALAAKA